MKITKLTNSIKIESEGNITIHALNTITAYIGQSRDSVTFKDGIQNIVTASVSEIIVNGTQMTTDNIESLLEELFFLKSDSNNSQTGTISQQRVDWLDENINNVTYINNRPFTKTVYTDPPVYPQAICTGHIVEFYKNSSLFRTYEWNGWSWVLNGAMPTFVFVSSKQKSTLGENVLYYLKDKDVYSLSLEDNAYYSDTSIYATQIKQSNLNFKIGTVNMSLTKDYDVVDLNNISAYSLSITAEDYEHVYNKFILQNCKADNLYFSVNSKKCTMDSIIYNNGGVSLKSSDITISNSSLLDYIITSLAAGDTESGYSTVQILNNVCENLERKPSISVSPEYNKVLCDIVIKGNKRLDKLSLDSFNSGSKINSFEGIFDKYLTTVYANSSDFTQDAFDSLITVLLNTESNAGAERNLSLNGSTPQLTDIQKNQLLAAGWSVS